MRGPRVVRPYVAVRTRNVRTKKKLLCPSAAVVDHDGRFDLFRIRTDLVLAAALVGRGSGGCDGHSVVTHAPVHGVEVGQIVGIGVAIRILATHGVGHGGDSPC